MSPGQSNNGVSTLGPPDADAVADAVTRRLDGLEEEPVRIALIGFRATGKSTVGRILAGLLEFSFVDMDERLVAGFGESIEAYVKRCGWPAFRQAEAELLTTLRDPDRQVVAGGGGLVLAPANRALLRRHFQVVWLDAGAATVLDRLHRDPRTGAFRPALTDLAPDAEVEALLREREPLYRQTAHLRVDTQQSDPEQLARRIHDWVRSEEVVADRR